jgi:LAO/AO transport system kinase
VETVGVGQSESAVASMVDVLLLLLMPHTGDDIQWVKKGLQELADLVIFNKADGLLRETAEAARRDYMESLKFLASLPGARIPQVFLCSATEGRGLDEIWRGIIASTTK